MKRTASLSYSITRSVKSRQLNVIGLDIDDSIRSGDVESLIEKLERYYLSGELKHTHFCRIASNNERRTENEVETVNAALNSVLPTLYKFCIINDSHFNDMIKLIISTLGIFISLPILSLVIAHGNSRQILEVFTKCVTLTGHIETSIIFLEKIVSVCPNRAYELLPLIIFEVSEKDILKSYISKTIRSYSSVVEDVLMGKMSSIELDDLSIFFRDNVNASKRVDEIRSRHIA